MAARPIPELRPLTLGELLDRTFALYRNHFWVFVGIMAIPSAFSIPSSALLLSARGMPVLGRPSAPSAPLALGAAALGLAFLLLFSMVYAMAVGAATYAVSEAYLGQKETVRGSYRKIRGKSTKIIGVASVALFRSLGMLLVALIGMGLAAAGIVGLASVLGRGAPAPVVAVIIGVLAILTYVAGIGLWALWSLRYGVCIPALLLENLDVLPALRRSVHLTEGRRSQMFVAVALCTVIAYTGVILFQGPFFVTMMFTNRGPQIPEWLGFIFATSGAIGGALTGPLLLIILVLYYYDTRIRKEAFDLQFMMASLDAPLPAPGTTFPG